VAAAYLLALLLQSASCGRKKLLSNNTVAVVVRRQHSTSLFSPSKFKDFSAALVIGQDAREKKTKTNRPTLGRTTGEFFDVLEISETQKQLTAPRQRFLRCTDGDQIFKGKPKIRRPAYFQRHNNAITSCAKSKCLRFALFAHQMFDQKKKIGQKQVRNLRGAGPGGRRDVAGTIKTRQREEFEAVTVCVYHDGAYLRLFELAFKTNNHQCVKSVDKKN
jgi:hypothetical protein